MHSQKLPTENARDSVERDPIGIEIVEDTCAVLPPVVADLLRFILLTGCRPSEATSSTPSVIDTTVTPWVLRPKTHKTKKKGHDRIIQIGPKARAILTRWLVRETVRMNWCFLVTESTSVPQRQT